MLHFATFFIQVVSGMQMERTERKKEAKKEREISRV
jgi:hypothetical protein